MDAVSTLELLLVLAIYLAVGWTIVDVAIFIIVRQFLPNPPGLPRADRPRAARVDPREADVRMQLDLDAKLTPEEREIVSFHRQRVQEIYFRVR